MTPRGLLWRALRRRRAEAAWVAFGVALGVSLAVALLVLRAELATRLSQPGRAVPLVVGPPGSPLQLVLSAVFHLDAPVGTLPRAQYDAIAAHPSTRIAVPYAQGDRFRGSPVVATDQTFFAAEGPWSATLETGRPFAAGRREVVVGADAAHRFDLRVGDRVELGHGPEEASHAGAPLWEVVGVMRPTGAPVDRVLFIDLAAFYAVDEHRDAVVADGPQLTAILVVPKAGMHRAVLAAELRRRNDLVVAESEVEIGRLLEVVGRVDRLLLFLALATIGVALLGASVSLHQSARSRRRELALLRAIGATRRLVYGLVAAEAAVVTTAGALAGLCGGHGLVAALGPSLRQGLGFAPSALRIVPSAFGVVAAVIAAGTLAGALATRRVYSLDVTRALEG